MSVELTVPSVGESVTEVQVGGWLVQPGERVERDQVVVVIETDKASVEVSAPAAGTIAKVLKTSGMKVKPGDVLGVLEAAGASSEARREPRPEPPRGKQEDRPENEPREVRAARPSAPSTREPTSSPSKVMPAAARVLAEKHLAADQVKASGPGGRLLKEDALRASGPVGAATTPSAASPGSSAAAPPLPAASSSPPRPSAPTRPSPPQPRPPQAGDARLTEVVPMSPLRRTVARRLVEAQQSAALLTTFNEIDMGAVMDLRRQHGEAFHQKHGVKLGFMSFFVKAVVEAVAAVPSVNAQIRGGDRGDEIVYHHYCDVGIAVGGGKGLVVPVLRDAEKLSFAESERRIADFAKRAQEGKLALDELTGGTFTISNGGIYGSLLSTPIVNPPQSGILGLHAIQDRPVARDGQVVVRPMMYVALTYDHRLVDGREAVTFLKRVKECVESPSRILLDV